MFASDSSLKSICGPQFVGLETPIPELVEVAEWGIHARQRLASLGESGLRVREFLFAATIDQLDRLDALGGQAAFSSLAAALTKFSEEEGTPWGDIVKTQRVRADRLTEVANVFQRDGFRPSCSDTNVAADRDALQDAEKCIAKIEEDTIALALVSGSVDGLRQNLDAVTATLEFADLVASMALPPGLIAYLFEHPDHVIQIQSSAGAILGACSELSLRTNEANELAQIDSALWCRRETFDKAPLQQLLDRNLRALQHVAALRDYLNFLLAEDAACDQGVGPVLASYSGVGLDYRNLTRAVEFVFYRSVAEAVLNSDPRLRRHSGATHQELRKQFQALDREYLEVRRKQLALT